MKHPKREGSPMAQDVPMCPMSPNTRRRAEFTIKQLQSGMMGRARSTLSTLGDVWRPRSAALASRKPSPTDVSLPPKGPSNRTLEFLTLWARHKKSTSDENTASPQFSSRDKSQSRKSVLVDTSNKKSSTVLSNAPRLQAKSTNICQAPEQDHQLRSRRRRHNTITNSDTARMTTSLSLVSSGRRYSRNNSLDMSELLLDRAKIDDLVFANGRPGSSPLKMRRNSYAEQIASIDPEQLRIPSNPCRASADLDQRIIKARLKLQKVASCDAGTERHHSTAVAVPKAGILHRHTGATVSPEATRSEVPAPGSDETISGPDGNCLLPVTQSQRPRKKLSFRIPVEHDGHSLAIKSDTLPRARRFLERYEQTMQTQNVELEVRNWS